MHANGERQLFLRPVPMLLPWTLIVRVSRVKPGGRSRVRDLDLDEGLVVPIGGRTDDLQDGREPPLIERCR
jgi:hypothetical protein